MSTEEMNMIETSPEQQVETPVTENLDLSTEETPLEMTSSEETVEVTQEAADETVPVYTPKTFDIDIDFDNFTVSEKRADSIRALLANVKSKTWLASIKDWVDAEGQAYYPYGEQTEMGQVPSKRIAWEASHVLETLELINEGVDTEIRIEGKRYLALQKLPKGDELLMSQFNPELSQKFSDLEAELHANLKVFLKAKADKQKAFQEKFKK